MTFCCGRHEADAGFLTCQNTMQLIQGNALEFLENIEKRLICHQVNIRKHLKSVILPSFLPFLALE